MERVCASVERPRATDWRASKHPRATSPRHRSPPRRRKRASTAREPGAASGRGKLPSRRRRAEEVQWVVGAGRLGVTSLFSLSCIFFSFIVEKEQPVLKQYGPIILKSLFFPKRSRTNELGRCQKKNGRGRGRDRRSRKETSSSLAFLLSAI